MKFSMVNLEIGAMDLVVHHLTVTKNTLILTIVILLCFPGRYVGPWANDKMS